MAEQWALMYGVKTLIFKPEWDKYGKAAGPKRNVLIIENADYLIAFPSKTGKGTQNSIKLAQEKRIAISINYID